MPSPPLPSQEDELTTTAPTTSLFPGLAQATRRSRKVTPRSLQRAATSPRLGWGPGLELPPGGPSPKKYHRGPGFKSQALSALGGDKVDGNSTTAPGTRSTPQSDKALRAHSPDEETEAQRAHAGHSRSQSKSTERWDWDPGIPV